MISVAAITLNILSGDGCAKLPAIQARRSKSSDPASVCSKEHLLITSFISWLEQRLISARISAAPINSFDGGQNGSFIKVGVADTQQSPLVRINHLSMNLVCRSPDCNMAAAASHELLHIR